MESWRRNRQGFFFLLGSPSWRGELSLEAESLSAQSERRRCKASKNTDCAWRHRTTLFVVVVGGYDEAHVEQHGVLDFGPLGWTVKHTGPGNAQCITDFAVFLWGRDTVSVAKGVAVPMGRGSGHVGWCGLVCFPPTSGRLQQPFVQPDFEPQVGTTSAQYTPPSRLALPPPRTSNSLEEGSSLKSTRLIVFISNTEFDSCGNVEQGFHSCWRAW